MYKKIRLSLRRVAPYKRKCIDSIASILNWSHGPLRMPQLQPSKTNESGPITQPKLHAIETRFIVIVLSLNSKNGDSDNPSHTVRVHGPMATSARCKECFSASAPKIQAHCTPTSSNIKHHPSSSLYFPFFINTNGLSHRPPLPSSLFSLIGLSALTGEAKPPLT